MQQISLKLKEEVMKGVAKIPIVVDSLTPDKLFGKSESEIKAEKVWWGNRQENTGDLFEVEVDGEAGSASEVKIVWMVTCRG